MVYLYDEGEFSVFMNNETFETVSVTENISEERLFLIENLEVTVLFYNSRPVPSRLPNSLKPRLFTVAEDGQHRNRC